VLSEAEAQTAKNILAITVKKEWRKPTNTAHHRHKPASNVKIDPLIRKELQKNQVRPCF